MKLGGNIVIFVLLAAIFCSSLAGAVDPCGAHDAGPATGQAVVQDSTGQHQHHGNAAENQAEGTECPCCDDCVVACVMSACNPAAASVASADLSFDGPDRFVPFVTFLHAGPVLHPPFRPPIRKT